VENLISIIAEYLLFTRCYIVACMGAQTTFAAWSQLTNESKRFNIPCRIYNERRSTDKSVDRWRQGSSRKSYLCLDNIYRLCGLQRSSLFSVITIDRRLIGLQSIAGNIPSVHCYSPEYFWNLCFWCVTNCDTLHNAPAETNLFSLRSYIHDRTPSRRWIENIRCACAICCAERKNFQMPASASISCKSPKTHIVHG
jgi:hypothetical protein